MEANSLTFTCPGLDDGGLFPIDCTGRGQDCSPEFVLRNLAPEAKTLAVTLVDESHPIRDFPHWVIWNLPAADRIPGAIPPGRRLPNGAVQGLGYGFHRYAGPKPPRGTSHRYRFTLYVLDCTLSLGPSSTRRKVLRAADGHVLQQGQLCGFFE